ncbi:MAG: winged helix-turn-helix transcriptional regulator [Bacteroidales bacterium]|nr:winged helix-turn-helix transcriptional regulator [Bacteroidales bacterium]
MAQSKTELFDSELTNKALIFKVLAHPARLKILQYLVASKRCITGDISDELPLSRTTVNQHLKELKTIGLLDWHTEGVKTYYCLNPQKVIQFQTLIQEFFNQLHIECYECK